MPHLIASFGGGYKSVLPGVAGRATISHNHSLNCKPETFNMVGQSIERNPMRLDLEEAGRMVKPPVFIVNAVLNSKTEIVRVVSGDGVAAHREGCGACQAIYGAAVPGLADVVIANSRPMDQDFRQGMKALANTLCAVRPGGVHITLMRANEGVGVFALAQRKTPLGRGAFRALSRILVRAVPRLRLKGLGGEDRFFLYFALQAMRRTRLLMYAPTIPAEAKTNLLFTEFNDSLDSLMASAGRRFPGRAEVLVFPYGGSTYPILPT